MSNQDVTQITLGKLRVGIIGLKTAIEQTKPLRGRPDEEIAQILLDQLQPQNYIPATAREEYRKALLREFKKALGEKIEPHRGHLIIKILGPGCPACQNLEQTVMAMLMELKLPAEVEHVTDPKEIAALGVFATPALIINDEVKTIGKLPTRQHLNKWFLESQNTLD